MVAHENAEATRVTVLTLDEETERQGIDRIDMIKIDVEGYEPNVLAGARRLLRKAASGQSSANSMSIGFRGQGRAHKF